MVKIIRYVYAKDEELEDQGVMDDGLNIGN
jgi:hypothetical protein